MNTLAGGISYVDLQFQGRPRIIATAVLQGPGGAALIDPGPSSCLPALRQGLADRGLSVPDLDAILLTHIHLDHAGATGTLAAENPRIRVSVHERGAPHMVDPSKLLASASRLYGADMDRLWGEVAPVPAGNLQILAGGERVAVAGRSLEVAYTPGHASHHVSYFDAGSGLAFVGDAAGVKIGTSGFVMPPTPPPDIDLETWEVSLSRIGAWRPDTLFLTHFGPAPSVQAHLAELREQIAAVAAMAKRSMSAGPDDETRFANFAKEVGIHLRSRLSEEEASAYERAAPIRFNWLGLARYWRKRGI